MECSIWLRNGCKVPIVLSDIISIEQDMFNRTITFRHSQLNGSIVTTYFLNEVDYYLAKYDVTPETLKATAPCTPEQVLADTLPPDKIDDFSTGAIRSADDNKIKWHLIPVECLERVAVKYTDGAKIYGDDNWKKGIPVLRYIGSALRHFMQYRLGDRKEDHLAAVVFNIFGIMFEEFRNQEYPYQCNQDKKDKETKEK